MKIPNSPSEFIKGCLDSALEDLGDGSQVTIPSKVLKQIMDGYYQAMQLVADQQKVIDVLTKDA